MSHSFSKALIGFLSAALCIAVGHAAPVNWNSTALPKNYGFVLFPGFQALDVFGPLDALNMLAWTNNMNLYIIADTMAPVSNVVRNNPINAMNSTFGQYILPTHTFENAPPLDVLMVPGGLGTRAPQDQLQSAIDFIQSRFSSLQYFFTICTGAGLAARAGVLDGRRATTNKAAYNETTALRPQVNWVSHARWVTDGNIWTTSGVSAGMDGMWAFISAVYGNDTAQRLSVFSEYTRELNSSFDPFADYYGLP